MRLAPVQAVYRSCEEPSGLVGIHWQDQRAQSEVLFLVHEFLDHLGSADNHNLHAPDVESVDGSIFVGELAQRLERRLFVLDIKDVPEKG